MTFLTGGPFYGKTEEEKREIIERGKETRRRNREARDAQLEADRKEYKIQTEWMRNEINELEKKLAALVRMEVVNTVSAEISGKALLHESVIVMNSRPWKKECGVYFLIKGDKVVYVGQSVGVMMRLHMHSKDKDFDRYAFVTCEPDQLDALESLYIHLLNPPLNGVAPNGAKLAPLSLKELCSHVGAGK